MTQIYYLILACILAVGVFMAGVYWKQMLNAYRRLLRRKKRNSLATRIEQLEMRVDLHTRKDGTYLNKFDEMEEQIVNVAERLTRRDKNRKDQVRREVRDYLKELQK